MSDPRPDEFRRFHDLLVEHAPDGYTPWYFRVREGSKAPATKYGSWKDDDARLSVDEAVAWMEEGGNVGIAGTADDALVNVDIDDEDETTPADLKDTLIARSRSRTGVHAWYFAAPDEEIPNIPTDDAGEVRANWQYVVAPGSYVDTDPDAVPDEHRDEAGYYTVEQEAPVTSLRFDELPEVFREQQEQKEQQDAEPELQEEPPEGSEDETDSDRNGSALFDISAEDVVRKEGGSTDEGDRFGSIFHGSDTDANTNLSNRGLIQCWRHNVAHNGYQALVTLSDYSGGCEQVGTPHTGSNAGSGLSGDDGATWHAWKYAKQNGYIPDDDPVPYSALKHMCRERDLCAVSEIPDGPDDGSLPAHAYDDALKTIEEHDGLNPGRVPTAEIDDGSSVPDKPNVERVDANDAEAADTESLSCADCDGEAYLWKTEEDPVTDAVESAKYYLCPDCSASAQKTKRGGSWDDPQWDQEASAESNRELLDEAGVAYARHDSSRVTGVSGESPDTAEDAVTSEVTSVTSEDESITSISALDVHNGGYGYFHTNDDGESWFERVTNFTLDVESFFFKDGERLIDMTVVPSTGEQRYDLTVEAKVFNDARRFRDNVVTGLTTTFEGSPSDLNELRKLVGGQDAPVRTGTHHMGLHPETGEFVTPDGVLTADGWTDDPEMAYIEREIATERAFELAPDTYDGFDEDEVAEILELLPKTRNSDRFLPVLGWLYTAPFRPYIQKKTGQFNTLHVTGETGAGKSSTLSLTWQLLGMNGEPMSVDDTKFSLITAFASSRSVPIWFDEYKPGDMKDWQLDTFHNLLRKSTRGGVETRGNADKSTTEYHLNAPLMVSGEQAVQGAAEERRSIQTRFRDDVKDPGSETRRAFAKLTGTAYEADGETRYPSGYDLQQHAYAYYQFVTAQNEEAVIEQWHRSGEYVRDLLETHGVRGVDDTPLQGIQTIHFGISMYARFATGLGADELPSHDEIDAALLYIAEQFGDDGDRKSHLDRFLELTSRAASAEYIEEDQHYTVVKAGTPEEEVALKLPLVFDAVSKYARDYGLDGEDMLNTASDYKERVKEAAEKAGTYVNDASQYTTGLNRCVRIDSRRAAEKIGFDPSAFGGNPRVDDAEPAAGSAAADGGAEQEDGDDEPADGDPPDSVRAVEDTVRESTEPLSMASIIQRVEIADAEKAKRAFEKAKENGRIVNPGGSDGYELP